MSGLTKPSQGMSEVGIGPKFDQLVGLVGDKSPFQKKKIARYLATRDVVFFREAEDFAVKFFHYLKQENIQPSAAVDAYLQLCDDMMRCQMQFIKLGRYPIDSFDQASEQVYQDDRRMTTYMIGLAISQFLWPTHFEIFTLFANVLRERLSDIKNYLEIGPGHGLFLAKALEILSSGTQVEVVDISPSSIRLTQQILKHFRSDDSRVEYHQGDMLSLPFRQTFDFITMCEVLEHVTTPDRLLRRLRELLRPNGCAYISTCVDCPAIDHVYHYHSITEIQSMIKDCGFTIAQERILPVEDLPMEEIVRRKITINYCALLYPAL